MGGAQKKGFMVLFNATFITSSIEMKVIDLRVDIHLTIVLIKN